jgi:hypothetical protein
MQTIKKSTFQQRSLLLKISLIVASISVACSCGEASRGIKPDPMISPRPPLLTAIESSSDSSDKATVAERVEMLIKKVKVEQDKYKEAQQGKASKKHQKEKAKKLSSPIQRIKKVLPKVGLKLKRLKSFIKINKHKN